MLQLALTDRPAAGSATAARSAGRRRPFSRLAVAGAATMIIAFAGAASAQTLPPATFADLAAKVTPAVVNISSTHHEQAASEGAQGMPDMPQGSPFDQFFHNFRQHRKGGEEVKALGSGFIIDSSGYIVTNEHVVDTATDIVVTLNDGKDYPAKLIGADKKTDLALLKIDAGKPLPAVSFGNSDTARVGDWILAVGNPFGLGGTVTTGIISARSRDIHSGPFDDFLQIDASINKGNSGGPTFNLAGEVIGVNSAIYSPNGGSVGIGFAIPAKEAKPVLDALREHGKVDRGWIGVQIQPVTPEIAGSLGLPSATGTLVAAVQANGPAAKAKMEQGDVILSFNGQDVAETRELPRIVAATPAGKPVDVVVWRNGERKTLRVTVAQMKEDEKIASADTNAPDGQPQATANEVLGVQLSSLTPDLRQQLGLGDEVTGVVVMDVTEGSPAAQQGLRQGDVIEQVAHSRVSDPAQVDKAVSQAMAAKKSAVLLLVNRQGDEVFLAIKVGKA
jgi:serine protease Do